MKNIKLNHVDQLISNEDIAAHLSHNKVYLKEALENVKTKKDKQLLAENEEDLGWLNVDEWAGAGTLEVIQQEAERVRADADVFVLIGVGGSNQAARAVIKALQQDNQPEILYLGNNISANYVNRILRKLEGKSVYINIIAKNFETLEPGIGFRILRDYLYEKYGDKASERIAVTGTKDSWLHQLSQKHGYTFFKFPENIGGRFSVLSNVGLYPMAVAGININELVSGARDMEQLLGNDDSNENMAFMYATYRNVLLSKGYGIEMLASFEPQFDYFAKWWIQLFAESEGKDDKGIFPVSASYSEDLHSVGQYVQDGRKFIFETFIDVEQQNSSYTLQKDHVDDRFDYLNDKDLWNINKDAFDATVNAHREGGIPCSTITVPEINEYYFGQLFYFFMFSCYISGRILEVNPFDQPGVEAYKRLMFNKLGKN